MRRSSSILLILGLLAALPALRCAGGASGAGGAEVTFTRDVAPILFEHCVSCHRPGESAPFPLLTYRDARKRARQIASTTASGFMPPWLPSRDIAFQGSRGLSTEQVAALGRWVDTGTPRGDAADLPPEPRFADGWQLGEPDRVIELGESYTLPAAGEDVIRNFVIPSPLATERWIRAVEVRPGNKRVVHHAILKRDTGPRSRRLERLDPEPGFGGMEMGNAEHPDGQIIVWTPGITPHAGTDGIAWRLGPGADLVLQLHMVPAGRPEAIRPRIGLYFSATPPTLQPFTLLMRNDAIDIPAGESAYVVESDITLPVAVRALGIYPHAHYLARRMEVWADAPGGASIPLLRIEDWNFDWQGMYHYAEPLVLPAGAQVRMRYTYDNSEANVRNPTHPPRRVTIGNRSSDEMATLALQVLTDGAAERRRLQVAQWEDLLEDAPGDPSGYYNLGVIHAEGGDFARAAEYYERALALDPDDAATRFYLGGAYYKLGREDLALDAYRAAAAKDPRYVDAGFVLGLLLARRGDDEEAAGHLRRVVDVDPAFAEAHFQLARVLRRLGRTAEAQASAARAAELDPEKYGP